VLSHSGGLYVDQPGLLLKIPDPIKVYTDPYSPLTGVAAHAGAGPASVWRPMGVEPLLEQDPSQNR